MRVEALAQVHLDVERLLAGDEPAAAHEHRRDEAQDDDRPYVEPELVRVAVRQRLVDDVLPRHQDERDLTRLRADRETDRDDEAALVRAEERKKPRERAAVGDRAHPFECSEVVLCSCRMDAAPDGSPVGLYARLPELGEGEVVAAVLPGGVSLLELGCGAGRITRQLVRLGYRVTAVDESREMLAHVRDAEAREAPIEGLELGGPSPAFSSRATSSTRSRRAAARSWRPAGGTRTS